MPNNNSVSQAAALAAFNGINKKDDSMFNIPLRTGSILNVARPGYINTRGSRPGSVSHPKLQLDKLNIPGDKKIVSSPSTPMSSAARSPNEDPSKSQAKHREPQSAHYTTGNDYFGLKSSDSSKVAIARTTSAKEMINSVKNSIESLTTPVDTSRRRISQNYEPQEMLKNVRNSINSKTVSRQSVELNSRNLAMINAIRDLIDLKKISNSATVSSGALNSADDSKLQSASFDNDLHFALDNKRTHSRNNSLSSLESAFLELGGTKESLVPNIIVDNHGKCASNSYLENSVYEGESPNNSYEIENSAEDDLSSENYDNMKQTTIYPEYSHVSMSSVSMDSSAEDAVITMYESESPDNETKLESLQKAKPKRKPPPMINNEDEKVTDPNLQKDNIQSIPVDVYSSDRDSLETDITGDRRASVDYFNNAPVARKLPQFPDLSDRSKSEKHPLFRRYLKMKSSEKMPITALLPQDIEQPSSEGKVYLDLVTTSRLSTPHLHQPVQLKTTMRKTNKKKEKKMKFNEYKPWKNHIQLSQITEQERKRYEGVWASNKGAYIDRVVTKLAGVDYNSDNSKELLSNEHEISKRAALLSANASKLDASKLSDQLKFHNIESAEKTQLLHGILVKRTWQRSRLPSETLEAIWNLVDFRRDGTLNKPEFLVGMWLIDQCLYGRKLPKKVDDVVWDSLGYIGVNVVIKKSSRR